MGSLGQTPGVGEGPLEGAVVGTSLALGETPYLASRGILQLRHQKEKPPGWREEMRKMGNRAETRRRGVGLGS